jgi:hypothetical protein
MRHARKLGLLVAIAAIFATTAVAVGGTPQQKDSHEPFKFDGNVTNAVDPQNSDNDVVRFDTATAPDVADTMGRKLKETVSQVTDQVELKYLFEGRDCQAGSPRVDLFLDTDGNHKFGAGDTVLRGYVDPTGAGGCAQDRWTYVDLANLGDPTARWEPNNDNSRHTWSDIVATYGGQDILFGQLVDDSQAFSAADRGLAYYDDVSIGNRTFTAHEDGH